mmetsp:Transcript_65/g.187  ORF Transcript_65/g.187 Transcript_65/m.187 type:complete len:276 (+) Transcript_65:882-1709(+)
MVGRFATTIDRAPCSGPSPPRLPGRGASSSDESLCTSTMDRSCLCADPLDSMSGDHSTFADEVRVGGRAPASSRAAVRRTPTSPSSSSEPRARFHPSHRRGIPHTRAVPSPLPVSMTRALGCTAIESTGPRWPTAFQAPTATDGCHTRALPSREAVRRSAGAQGGVAMAVTASLCPVYCRMGAQLEEKEEGLEDGRRDVSDFGNFATNFRDDEEGGPTAVVPSSASSTPTPAASLVLCLPLVPPTVPPPTVPPTVPPIVPPIVPLTFPLLFNKLP